MKIVPVDVGIEPGCQHGENSAQQIDVKISQGMREIAVRSSEQAKERGGKQLACHCNDHSRQNEHGKCGVHDLGSSPEVAFAASDRAERSAAQPEQVCEGGDHDDDRKAKSDAAQRGSAFAGNPAYVNTIHNAVEEAQDLRDQHREHALHDVAENFSVSIIYLSHNYSAGFYSDSEIHSHSL